MCTINGMTFFPLCVCVCVCTGDSVVGIRTRIYAGRSVVRIPAGATHLSLLQNILMGSGALFSEYRCYCPGVMLTPRLYLAPRLGMSAVMALLPLYALMALTGIILSFYLIIKTQNSACLY